MRIEPLLFLPHISHKLLCPIRRSWLALGHCCSYFISVTYYDVQSLVHGSPSDQIQLVETISLVSLDLPPPFDGNTYAKLKSLQNSADLIGLFAAADEVRSKTDCLIFPIFGLFFRCLCLGRHP